MATIIEQRGKFLARVRVTGHKPLSCTFNTYRAANAWAVTTEDDVRRGVYQARPVQQMPTLRKALQKYGENVLPRKRGSAKEAYFLRFFERLQIASRPLDQVDGRDLSALRDQWAKTVAAATITRRLAVLSHLYNTARRDWGLDLSNPVNDVTKPKVQNRRERLVSDAELDAVLAGATLTLDRIARLAKASAARLGELAALTWPNVDLEASTMTFPLTKNGSARTVPLTPAALALLTAMKPKRATRGSVFGTSSETVSQAWARAVHRARKAYEKECKQRHIAPDDAYLRDLHFHDLRHTAITNLAENGLSTLELASISGHKSLNMLARYTHISATRMAAKLAALQSRATVAAPAA